MRWRAILGRSIATAVAIVLASPAARAQSVEHPTNKLILDWSFQGPEAAFILPARDGVYHAQGLEVSVEPGRGSSDAARRVGSGAFEFGWGDMSSLIQYDAENPESPLIAIYVTGDKSALAIMAIRGRGIATPRDLEGRTVATAVGGTANAMFDAFASTVGIDVTTVHWRTVSSQLRDSMLVSGEVDAAIALTTASVLSIRELGVKPDDIIVMPFSQFGADIYGTALWTRAQFAKDNPKTVAAMVRAVNRGYLQAIADPKTTVATLAERDPLAKLDIECERLAYGLSTLTMTERVRLKGVGAAEQRRLEITIKASLAAAKSGSVINVDQIYTDRFLPPEVNRIPPALGSCG